MTEAAKDRNVPIALGITGLVVDCIAGLRVAGPAGITRALIVVAIVSMVGTAIMIAAAYVTATLTGQSFGELNSASLKMGGIYIFSSAIYLLLGGGLLGLFVSDVIFFALMLWLFELEVPYAVVFTLVMMGIEFVIGLILAAVLRV